MGPVDAVDRALHTRSTIAKAALLTGEDILMDSIHCASFDPLVEALPGDLTHTAFIAGVVSAVDDSMPTRRFFILAISEYVHDECHAFHVWFVFDSPFVLLRLPPEFCQNRPRQQAY